VINLATTYQSDISRFLIAGIKEVWKRNLQAQRETYYDKCSSKKTSNKAAEYYDTVGNISPASFVAENSALPYNKIKQGYRVTATNKKAVNGIEISCEANDDDLTGSIDEAKVGGLMRTMIALKEEEVAAQWNTVFTATGGDGVAPAHASHPLINSVLLNNNATTGTITPDNVITAANLFNDIYDQAGKLFDTEATQILAHKNQMARIMAVLESSLKAYELSNTKNTVPTLKPVLSKYLSKTYWHLRDETIDSVILQERQGMEHNVEKDAILNYVWRANFIERYCSSIINPGYGFVSSTGA
jgi:hypothetical protein